MRYPDNTTIALSAAQVRSWSEDDSAALRARGPAIVRSLLDSGESEHAAVEAVRANLASFSAYLSTHPTAGALLLDVRHAHVHALDGPQEAQS